MDAPAEFRPDRILAVLEEHGVRYILIGGLAATLHGSAHPTFDVDITPELLPDNLARLSEALRALNARIRVEGVPGGFAFAHDAASLADVSVLNLVTDAGDLDLAMHPAGLPRYEDWACDALRIEVLGVVVSVAALHSVITSKEAAGRPKDALTLPTLRALLERQQRG